MNLMYTRQKIMTSLTNKILTSHIYTCRCRLLIGAINISIYDHTILLLCYVQIGNNDNIFSVIERSTTQFQLGIFIEINNAYLQDWTSNQPLNTCASIA